MTPKVQTCDPNIRLESNISKTTGDAITIDCLLWGSTVGYPIPSDSLTSFFIASPIRTK